MPVVSIITSTHNRAANFLPKCIASVKNQTYKYIEHIIVDDCSTDETRALVKNEMAEKGSKIRYFRTEENFGSDTKPKNIGIKQAKGKYILFLDDDVTLRKKAIEHLLAEIKKGFDVVYGDMWIKPNDERGIFNDFDLQYLSLRNYIDSSSALIKKEALEYIGGFDETLPKFVDWNLFIRLAKAGFQFKRLPEITFNYYIHKDTKSQKVKTPMYRHPALGMLYVPTFDTVACKVRLPYLGEVKKPKVAIFTIHYDRLDYSKQTYKEMVETAGYDFDWFCADNGTDGTYEWLRGKCKLCTHYPQNVGISRASNELIDVIKKDDYDIIIKIDNDVEFITYGWLKDIVELWEKNHLVYVSPYVEGLVDNPGGALRLERAMIDEDLIEITAHIGGIFAAVDQKAYDEFRWSDKMLHGYQDLEASTSFAKQGYMPCYLPKHIIRHRDSTEGQHAKYKDYFERRKLEKKTEEQ